MSRLLKQLVRETESLFDEIPAGSLRCHCGHAAEWECAVCLTPLCLECRVTIPDYRTGATDEYRCDACKYWKPGDRREE